MTRNKNGLPEATGGTAEIVNNQQGRSLLSKKPKVKFPRRSRRRHKGLRPRRSPQWQYLYDGRSLVAVIELRTRWHVLMHGRDDLGESFPTRERALQSVHESLRRGAA
jgi:hypothetical protein